MRYRRANIEGGTYFFTVNLADRNSDMLIQQIDDLRTIMRKVKQARPFKILAMVVLPEHLHAVWRLPRGDADYPQRWSLIKSGFSRRQEKGERIHASRNAKRERGIWQRRYWEHQIRDEADLVQHVDYIHFNPVKHGWVKKPVEWPHSTLHGYIERGMAPRDWGCSIDEVENGFGER